MKSLRKFNFFRNTKHSKEDKENLDESHHVRFHEHQDIISPEQLKRKSLKRRNSDENLMNPTGAYRTNPQPRITRPTRSCYDERVPAASSSDEDTLVSQRTSYRNNGKSSRRPQQPQYTMQLQQKKVQICTNDFALQTSSEYGSGGPSPVNDHLTFESHNYNDSRGTEYWKKKYRYYKEYSRMLQIENSQLREREHFYAEKQSLYDHISEEAKTLRKQNHELQSQIASLNMQLRSLERNHYSMQHSAYPMFPTLTHNQFNNHQQHCGAGEKLVSQVQLPKYSNPTVTAAVNSLMGSSSIQTSHYDEEDETKNFRNERDQSSDEPFATSQQCAAMQSRGESSRSQSQCEYLAPQAERVEFSQDDAPRRNATTLADGLCPLQTRTAPPT
jgi:hypothetical protein